tara:strand:- start:841 stop:1263 length:423 start_codon:yes stop_codon:yes gene_type:complete
MKKNLLFLCTGNSCRSQMAEGIANKLLPEDVTIKSAGTEAQGVNPNAIKVMSDLSIPISHHKSERIDFKDLDNFDIIITLCGDAKDKCPIFDSKTQHIHWGIEDPAVFVGNENETYLKYKEVRDILFDKISDFKKKLRNI